MEGSGATLHTPPFHGKQRTLEAELREELGRSFAACTKHPGDLGIGAHSPFDEPATDTLTAMRFCHDEHGEVAIGLAVSDSADKADDLSSDNCDLGDLRRFDERSELMNATNSLTPAIRGEQLIYARKL